MPDPVNLLNTAVKRVPTVRYALGVAGVVSAVAIIAGFKIDWRIAVFGTVVMFIFMALLVIFSALTRLKSAAMVLPATIFVWFSLGLFVAVALSLFTWIVADWPRGLASILDPELRPNATPGTGLLKQTPMVIKSSSNSPQTGFENAQPDQSAPKPSAKDTTHKAAIPDSGRSAAHSPIMEPLRTAPNPQGGDPHASAISAAISQPGTMERVATRLGLHPESKLQNASESLRWYQSAKALSTSLDAWNQIAGKESPMLIGKLTSIGDRQIHADEVLLRSLLPVISFDIELSPGQLNFEPKPGMYVVFRGTPISCSIPDRSLVDCRLSVVPTHLLEVEPAF